MTYGKELNSLGILKTSVIAGKILKLLKVIFFGSDSPEWQVKICNTNNKRISISLHNNKVNNEYRIKTFNCSVEFLNCDGLPLIWEQQENVSVHESTTSVDISIIDFEPDIKMNNSNNYKFLPNNTLTIYLWRTALGFTTPVSRFARTRIDPTTKVMKKIVCLGYCRSPSAISIF